VSNATIPGSSGRGIWWSAGATVSGSYCYMYGVRLDDSTAWGRSVYVARAPLSGIGLFSTWRFWNGSGWTANRSLGTGARLIDSQADTVVSVWNRGARWYLVTQKYGFFGRNIELWTASSPRGPWRDTRVLYTIPKSPYPDASCYEGAAHPEVPLSSGRLLLSYSRNGSWQHVNADANWYQPQYVEASLGG